MKKGQRIKKLQENRIRDGRGQGIGDKYQPFIQAHDNKVASQGWLTRHLGWKTKRIHHTLSEHERRYLLYLEWLDEVVDIREQFPLLPLSRTEEIAQQLGIKHPHVDGGPVVMTTDFIITLQTSRGLIDVVRTIKPASKLTKRTLELFEIERRFFNENGIDWCIITDSKLPKQLIDNIDWMCEAKYLETRPSVDKELVDIISFPLLEEINNDGGITAIGKLCIRCDSNFGLETGTSLFVLQHMLVEKRWETDMSLPIKNSSPLKITSLELGISTHKNLG